MKAAQEKVWSAECAARSKTHCSTPSPLNGERAGVRGAQSPKVGQFALRILCWLVLTLAARSANAQVASCPTNKTVECGSVWTFDDPTGAGPCTATNAPTIKVLSTVTNTQ